jgi:tetratricopeptide (TPR) repeat protein
VKTSKRRLQRRTGLGFPGGAVHDARVRSLGIGLAVLGMVGACAPGASVVRPSVPPAAALDHGLRSRSAERGVRLVREDSVFELDADGRKSFEYSLVYEVLSAAGLKAWSTLEVSWNPDERLRPQVDVRVTDPSGTVHTVGPDHIETTDEGTERVMQITLPGVEVGSVVERTVRYEDRAAPELGVTFGSYALGLSAPVARSRVVFRAPEELPLQVAPVGFRAEEVRERVVDGRRQVELQARDLPGFVGVQPLLPPEVPRRPRVLYSTARSWAELSERVEQRLEGALRAPELNRLVAEAAGPGGSALHAVIDEVHRRVRVVEGGPPPLRSRPPVQVLRTGRGTLAEKALVLTAALRTAGIDAHWALLRRGLGEDLVADVAAPQDLDGALVYLPGTDVFVDPSTRFLPPGRTTVAHQGRITWLATGRGRLVRTPILDATDNRYQEIRRIDLVRGPEVEIAETTTAQGTIEARLRKRFRGDVRLERQLSGYVRRSYRGGRLIDFDLTDAERLDLPFQLELVGRGGGLVRTRGQRVTVFLPAPILFSWLPDPLREATLAAEDPSETQRLAEQLLAVRKADMMVPEPFSAVVRFEIRVPASFRLVETLADQTERFGPALYQQKVQQDGDRIRVDVGFALDRSRITAEEARALVGGLRQLWSKPVPRLEFEDRPTQLIQDGKVREGLELLVAEAESAPAGAAPALRLARSLLEAKLGSAAGRWAMRAADARPDDIATLIEASEVLTHDPLGRPFGPGFSRKEAIGLLRQARRRSPRLPELNKRLAVLLSVDEHGLENTDPVALEEAVVLAQAAVRSAPRDGETSELLVELLMRAGRLSEIRDVAKQVPRSFEVDAHRLAATAILQGPGASAALLERLGVPVEVSVLAAERAARILVERQRYDLAARLLDESAHLAEQPEELQTRATLYRKVARGLNRSVPGPAEPVFRLQELLALNQPPIEGLQAVFTDSAWERFRPHGNRSVFGATARAAQVRARAAGVPVRWPTDLVRSQTTFRVEGDDRIGFRVESLVSRAEGPGPRGVWFVVKDGDYRIQAVESEPALLGRQALDWLDRGRRSAARKWLAWAADLIPAPKSPFRQLWDSEPQRLRWAAAALAPDDPRALRILRSAIERAPSGLRASLWAAVMAGHARRDEHAEQIAAARKLLEVEPESIRGHRGVFAGLLAQGRHEQAEAWARARAAAREPSFDPLATEELAQLAFFRGRYAEADRLYQDMVDRGFATAETYNNLAWLRLYRGPTTPRDRKLAVRAVEMTGGGSPAALHTLATHQVAAGDVVEGLQTLHKRTSQGLERDDWLVIGMALQELGLEEDAIDAFFRVRPEDERESQSGDSTWVLAARRIRELGHSPDDARH